MVLSLALPTTMLTASIGLLRGTPTLLSRPPIIPFSILQTRSIRRSARPRPRLLLPSSSRQLRTPTPQTTPPPPPSPSKWSFPSSLALFPALTLPASLSDPITPLSSFLLAHPLPTYTATIVLTTLFLRTALTLPITLWSRERMRKMRELVTPEMRKWNEVLAVRVAGESRKRGISYEGYKKELKKQLAAKQSALLKEHNCHPLPTAILPTLVHIPTFILLSMTIRGAVAKAQGAGGLIVEDTPSPVSPDATAAAQPAFDTLAESASQSLDVATTTSTSLSPAIEVASLTHPFTTETLLWCPNLIDPDPLLVIPFLIGLAVFSNVEVMQSWRQGLRGLRDPSKVGEEATRERQREDEADGGLVDGKPKRDFLGRRIVYKKPKMNVVGQQIPMSSTNTVRPGRQPLSFRPSEVAAMNGMNVVKGRGKSKSGGEVRSILEDETAQGNMTKGEQVQREERIEQQTLREKIVGNLLRGFAIVVVGIACEMPVAVAIYWLTSTTYTLVQNFLLDRRDMRRAAAVNSPSEVVLRKGGKKARA